MPQPYPNPNINSTVSLMKYVNTVTNDWYSPLVVIALSIIIFLILKRQMYRTSDSMLVSCLLTFLMSTFLWIVGLVAGKIIVIYLLLTAASGIYSILDE